MALNKFPGKQPTAEQNPLGFHKKYEVQNVDGSPVDPNAVYLVLRIDEGAEPDHRAASLLAARGYMFHATTGPQKLKKTGEDLRTIIDFIDPPSNRGE